MASKRAVRRRTCERKKHHESRESALLAKSKMPRGHELDAYRCQFCGQWVLGHRPGYYSEHINKRTMRGDTA